MHGATIIIRIDIYTLLRYLCLDDVSLRQDIVVGFF